MIAKKLLTYSIFAISCLVVIAAFITAKSYIQLAFATLLYPPLIFFGYKILPIKTKKYVLKKEVTNAKVQNLGISDSDKRAFLKLIGATGVSFFLISVFGRRIEALLFGQNLAPGPTLRRPSGGETSTPVASPTDGYKISEIEDNIIGFYGFINKDGGWFIMKGDNDTGSFRYAKGDANFPSNWKNREKLNYDYFHNVFKT